MGRVIVKVTASNFADASKFLEFQALVDTGASHLVLPTAWKEKLGPLETLRTMPAETATQEMVQAEICGPVRIQVEGFDPIAAEVMFIDMEPIDGQYEPMLGYTPLQQIPVTVDLKHDRLVSVTADLR
ncbi:MAG: aspartyl protease family protein [Planctomycetaceae bacterium]